MKNNIFRSSLMISMALLFVACGGKSKEDPAAKAQPVPINLSMQELTAQLGKLFPLALDPDQFSEPKNQSEIKQRLDAIALISAEVQHQPMMQSQDTTLAALSREFKEETQRAKEAFALERKEYARSSILHLTSYCLECHTRTPNGPDLFGHKDMKIEFKDTQSLMYAEYLVATRRFQEAFQVLTQILDRGAEQPHQIFDMDRASRLALVVAVRYMRSPEMTERVASTILKNKRSPFYLQSSARSWLASVDSWKRDVKLKKQDDAFALSQELLQRATQKSAIFENRFGDIEYLRIQSLLHPVVAKESRAAILGESLFILGVSYEQTRDMATWNLHEEFFEACIKRVPKTIWSQRCYTRLEESLFFGFSGSSGMNVPKEVIERLKRLREMAF